MTEHDQGYDGPSHDPEDLFDTGPDAPPSRGRNVAHLEKAEERVEKEVADAPEPGDQPQKKRRRRGGRKRSGEKQGDTQNAEQTPEAEESAQPTRPAKPEGDADGDNADRPKRKRKRRRRRKGGADEREQRPAARMPAYDDDDDEELDEPAPRRADKPELDDDEPHEEWDADEVFEADEIFAGVSFKSLGLRNSVLRGVHAAGYRRPTHIQAQLIPMVLSGKDVLGQARTGAGKTASFGLPMLHMAERGEEFQAVVLCPTRELAIQITAEIEELSAFTPIHTAAVYGGQPIPIQVRKLQQGPEIIVATPGRLMDLYEHRHLHFRNVRQIVLDEVDRMLDIGFRDDIRKILKNIQSEHQTVFVSATISEEIEALGRSFMNEPEKIVTTAGSLTVNTVAQYYLPVQRWDKKRLLLHLLTHEDPALTLIFCRTKRMVDDLTKYLREKNVNAQAIHGDMPQSKRNSVMKRMRGGELGVLVASDLAARGLDVEGISHVVNYDLPEDPEIYVHRIGRTARAGKQGVAWSFVSPIEGELLTNIEMLANIHIPPLEYPDFEPGEPPRQIREEKERKEKTLERMRSISRSSAPVVPKTPTKVDPNAFPDGLVPTKMPPKRLGGRVNTARAMKQQMKELPKED
jgi:ATP-dependent RNA helicase DeaD